MEARQEKAKTVTAHLVVSELPRAGEQALRAGEPESAYRPSEPPSAAWAGLEGWPMEGRLSNENMDYNQPQAEPPRAINYKNELSNENYGQDGLQQGDGDIIAALGGKRASRTKHSYDYYHDRKKQQLLESKLGGIGGIGFLQQTRQLSEAANKYKLSSWTDHLDSEIHWIRGGRHQWQANKSKWGKGGGRLESLRHSVEAPKYRKARLTNPTANLEPLRHSVALPKADNAAAYPSGLVASPVSGLEKIALQQDAQRESPNLAEHKPATRYPLMYFSPRAGAEAEPERDQHSQRKSIGQGKYLLNDIRTPLKDLKLTQGLESFELQAPSFQPRMIEQIKNGGQPIYQGSFGYQNVKTMRKQQIDERLHSQLAMKRSRQIANGMRLKHTAGHATRLAASTDLQGDSLTARYSNSIQSKDDVAAYMRSNERQLIQLQSSTNKTPVQKKCLGEVLHKIRNGSTNLSLQSKEPYLAANSSLPGTQEYSESFQKDSIQQDYNRLQLDSYRTTQGHNTLVHNTSNLIKGNSLNISKTPSAYIRTNQERQSYEFKINKEQFGLPSNDLGYSEQLQQQTSRMNELNHSALTARTRKTGEFTNRDTSMQHLIAMGYDPTVQHLSHIKRLFRQKFKLDQGESVLGSTIGSTSTRQRVTNSELASIQEVDPYQTFNSSQRASPNAEVRSKKGGDEKKIGNFNKQMNEISKIIAKQEQEIKSPRQKSGSYQKVKNEIERLDQVINLRKGIVPVQEEVKLGRNAARNEQIRRQEEEREAEINPIKDQIAIKIKELKQAMNTEKVPGENDDEDNEENCRIDHLRLGDTWHETQTLINQVVDNIKVQEKKDHNINRLTEELETLRRRLNSKMSQDGQFQIIKCPTPNNGEIRRKRQSSLNLQTRIKKLPYSTIKESDQEMNIEENNPDIVQNAMKQFNSKPKLAGAALSKFKKAGTAVIANTRKEKYTQPQEQILRFARRQKLYNVMDELLPGTYLHLGSKYRELTRNIWTNDFIEKLQDDQKAFADFNYRQDWLSELNNTFGAKVKSIEFYKEAKSMNAIPKRIIEQKSVVEVVEVDDDDSSQAGADDQGKEEMNLNQKLMRKYFASSMNRPEVPIPTFARISKNTLFVIESRITQGMAEGLKEYLEGVNKEKNPANIVQKLALSDNGLTDKAFSTILQGILAQKSQKGAKSMTMHSLVYSKNELGDESLQKLQPLLRDIQELDLNQVQIKPGHLLAFLEACGTSCTTRLAKLSLSRMNLGEVPISGHGLTSHLCELIGSCQLLRHLDLSWCSLTPKQLTLITKELLSKKEDMRSLNLSYNVSLSAPETVTSGGIAEGVTSPPVTHQLLDNLFEFLTGNCLVSHLDFSGMGLQREHLLKISHLVQEPNSNVLALHLSDNGIRGSHELLMEVLDCFDIEDECLEPQQRIHGLAQLTRQAIDDKSSMTLKTISKDYLKSINDGNSADFEQQMILMQQCRQVTRSRQEKLPETKSGIGGTLGLANSLHLSQLNYPHEQHSTHETIHSGGDNLVVTRQLNHAELIFNQEPLHDGFFDEHGADRWRLSSKGDCYICDKHRYSLIFFDQAKMQTSEPTNEELVEIKDPKQVRAIKEALVAQSGIDDDKTPIICGSVVSDSVFASDKINYNLKRKLKMLRADVFALLSFCLSSDLVSTPKQSKQIQQGLHELVQNQSKNFYSIQGPHKHSPNKKHAGSEDDDFQFFCRRLEGWDLPMYDMCNENQITDNAIINISSILKPQETVVKIPVIVATAERVLEDSIDETQEKTATVETPVPEIAPKSAFSNYATTKQVFAYAAFLPPGLHQFLIYCPETNRAFIKQIVIDVNGRDVYPQYPYTLKRVKRKPLVKRKNVWAPWKEDSKEMLKLACLSDLNNGCEPERFVKDENEVTACKQLLEQNFESLHNVFSGLAANSHQYPEIDAEAFLEAMMAHQENLPDGATPLSRAEVELAFMAATRNDKVGRMKGALCRGEFLEVVLRLAKTSCPKDGQLSDHLPGFIKDQMTGTLDDSEILNVRKLIRGNETINQLLWDNKALLQKLYAYFKDGRYFRSSSMKNALALLNESDEKHDEPFISDSKLTKLFRMSQMTVYRDKKNSTEYETLAHVEFLELIARVALSNDHHHGFPMDEEEKLFHLLQMLHERAAKHKIIDPEITYLEPMDKDKGKDSD